MRSAKSKTAIGIELLDQGYGILQLSPDAICFHLQNPIICLENVIYLGILSMFWFQNQNVDFYFVCLIKYVKKFLANLFPFQLTNLSIKHSDIYIYDQSSPNRITQTIKEDPERGQCVFVS